MSLASIVALAIAVVPSSLLVVLAIGVRALARREEVPRFVMWVGYAFAILGAVVVVVGTVSGVVQSAVTVPHEEIETSQKAHALAEGISQAMNCGALGLLFGLAGGSWIGFFAWKWRRGARR